MSKDTWLLRRSIKPEKKYDIVIPIAENKEKILSFGAKGYSDLTKHKSL